MEKLPTPRLLAYYKKLHRGIVYRDPPDPRVLSGRCPGCCVDAAVFCQQSEALRLLEQTKKHAKKILDTREHVEKKK